jgi:uncharacterized protein GlcG (DUF336 family)
MVPAANQAVRTRLWTLVGLRACLNIAFCLVLGACGGGGSGSSGSSGSGGGGALPPGPPPETETLSQADVQMVVEAAATAAQSDAMAIAVVDRLGRILAIYVGPSAPATSEGNFGGLIPTADLAVALARTGAFFSNDEAPLSSRTVRFISGIHFPPGVANTANAALYGIENTNRGCNLAMSLDTMVPPATTIAGASPGYGIITGKADLNDSIATAVNPGGVPIFKNGQEVGGVGVVAADPDTAEYVA